MKPSSRILEIPSRVGTVLAVSTVIMFAMAPGTAKASWIWIEGEKPYQSTMHRHPWWYDKVKRDQLSGGDYISNFDERASGESAYRVQPTKARDYDLWVRANPVQSRLSYSINGSAWTLINFEKEQQGNVNIAADDKSDLRFIAWVKAGKVPLKSGQNVVRFRMDSKNGNHGSLDCFVLTDEPFTPNGTAKPDQIAALNRRAAVENVGWFPFAPKADPFSPASGIDLRFLNEKEAGEGGYIGVNGAQFVHSKTGKPVKFWAVNGPPGKDMETLRREAKILAKRGVNMVRIHHAYYDPKTGVLDPAAVLQMFDVVEAMKAEGIYSHLSIYFPLWLNVEGDLPWLKGYKGGAHPFSALYFNEDFQKHYLGWWNAILLGKNPKTGKRLIDEPAVAGVEILNEDSYFFWTFDRRNIPDPQLRILETKFAAWLATKYGTLDAVSKRWGGFHDDRDKPAEGRLAFRALWNMANERQPRDKDAATFLAQSQRGFYDEMYKTLRSIGFKGLITATNWYTADPRVLGPIERYTYAGADFIDRHGYFAGQFKGVNSAWSIQNGYTYSDRSALRFDNPEPGKPTKVFGNPAADITYDGKPSMISEASWPRPNRYRSEAPLFFALYGALQGSDSVVHFALDGSEWSVKPSFYMQPWTLMSPGQIGQFPAGALIFRKGLVAEGDLLVDLNLSVPNLLDLQGTPMPQDAALDELRLKDVPKGTTLQTGNVIDPLVHFAGRTNVSFSQKGAAPVLKDLRPYIDHAKKTVVSTNKQLRLDYGKGLLAIDAPAAQGVSGNVAEGGTVELTDLSVTSSLDQAHIVAVSLDDKPLATSSKILLQVMSEEKPNEWKTEPAPNGETKILSIGRDPWLVKRFEGTVRFKRPDAAKLTVTALDGNGDALKTVVGADKIRLGSTILYYLIEKSQP